MRRFALKGQQIADDVSNDERRKRGKHESDEAVFYETFYVSFNLASLERKGLARRASVYSYCYGLPLLILFFKIVVVLQK